MTPNRFRAMLIIAALLALLPGTALLPLMDRDEPRFARATVEMIERDEWVVPFFNNEYRFDKPVLTYWLMRGGYALFGRTELGARAHSIAATVALLLLVYAMGRRWFSEHAGRFAALGLLLCFQMLIHGRSAVADLPMVLAVAAAQGCLFELTRTPLPRHTAAGWILGLGAALGLGFLAKGPIAWIVPVLTLILYRWVFWRKALPRRTWTGLGGGLLLALLILAPWGLLALSRTQGLFWERGMEHHVIRRGTQAFEGHGFVPGYYLLTSFISLFPWFAFLGLAWHTLRRNWNERNAFLVSWLVAPYLVFTFYATHLMHYVLPAYPAFLLILGQTAETAPDGEPRWGRIVRRLGLGLVGAVAAMLVLLGIIWDRAAPWGALGTACLGAGILLGGLLLGAGLRRRLALPLLAAVLGMLMLGMTLLATGLRETSPAVRLSRLVQNLPPDTSLHAARFQEPSLVFYGGRAWSFHGKVDALMPVVRRPGPACLVVTEREWKLDELVRARLQSWLSSIDDVPPGRDFTAEADRLRPPGDHDVTTIEGLNTAKGLWVRLRVIVIPPGKDGQNP